ncbi:ERF family protein [Christensenellaceae bacterium OttesenSCG-928-L17]|nr:ERF family protein [Christensenellaceae bacterium OttesenSCG-928-L17]
MSKNIFQRIHAVMQEVEYLNKDDKVETGGGKFYRAVTEEKVTTAIRAGLVKHGIVIIPISQATTRTDEVVKAYNSYEKREVEKINRVTTVDVEYRIQNVDDPNDFIIAASSGTGVDTQDKGVGKAMTYAYKYLLLRTFAIPTGEDPDKISSDLYTDKLTGTKAPPKEAPKNEPVEHFVISDTLNELRNKVKEIAPDAKKREAACMKKFNKGFMMLTEGELKEIVEGAS